jgi:DNA mismatch repair protein MutS
MKLESDTRESTGIKNLRIRSNKVFGYYFEVTNSYLSLVPDDFIRKQTLTNAERFTTDELSILSSDILSAEENLYGLEYDEFVKTLIKEMLEDDTFFFVMSDRNVRKLAQIMAASPNA